MSERQAPSAAWRTIGFWLAVPMALLQAVNAVRAVIDPAGFADYLGAPLAAEADAAWVFVYATRTAFVALLVAGLLLRGQLGALSWIALAALVMPLGDAWIAYTAGAPTATVARHLGIVLYLGLAAFALRRSAAARARARP
jgi:hypothetical protein